jgi:hypothetical protein
MQSLTLAYRDDDRTPVICVIRAMAARHYDLDVRIVEIKTAATMRRRFSTALHKRSPTPTRSRPSNTPPQKD